MEDEQFSLGLLAFQVQLAHATQLFESLVDVSHPQTFASVVSHPPLALPFSLLLGIQILVFGDAAAERRNQPAATIQSSAPMIGWSSNH